MLCGGGDGAGDDWEVEERSHWRSDVSGIEVCVATTAMAAQKSVGIPSCSSFDVVTSVE
jgi:hypothetical protein